MNPTKGNAIIIPTAAPPDKLPTPLERWADQAVQHLAHHFRLSQVMVREYAKFIFRSQAFTPQQIVDALGPAGAEVMQMLQSHADMIGGLLGSTLSVIPQGWSWGQTNGHVTLTPPAASPTAAGAAAVTEAPSSGESNAIPTADV
jgi:hypothetical protein